MTSVNNVDRYTEMRDNFQLEIPDDGDRQDLEVQDERNHGRGTIRQLVRKS